MGETDRHKTTKSSGDDVQTEVLSAGWELQVCVLRQDQCQFASTRHCGVNNGDLVPNTPS